MCLSPERFLSLHGHRVETSPVKGTRPRHVNKQSDDLARKELRSSEKDRAENLMIVDLLRNDLGRSCLPGSIHVDRLFDVQSFSTVHHMVSTITGELQPGRNAWGLLSESFPGGSITGAPKRTSHGNYCRARNAGTLWFTAGRCSTLVQMVVWTVTSPSAACYVIRVKYTAGAAVALWPILAGNRNIKKPMTRLGPF